MNGNVIRTITIRGTSEGLDKLQSDLVKLAGAHKGVAIAAEETDKKTRSLEQAWKAQTLRLDEAARAQNNIARESKIANQMLNEQRITAEQHAERLNLINQRYAVAGQATQKFTQQTGLARHELINLGRQAQDVGVSLASGQSPLMVLAQQGSQIADVFISSGKSVGDFFKQATSWALAFAKTPAGIVTGIAAIGAAALYAAYLFTRSSTTIEEALAEQNRLMKENKTAMDDLIAARMKLQTADLTQFQIMRNELDLRNKLKQAMKEQAEIGGGFAAQARATTPEDPTGSQLTAAQSAGYEKIGAAVAALNAAIANGQPGLAAYNAELGRIGLAHPELAKNIEFMVREGEEALKLEQAWLRIAAAKNSAALIELNNTQMVQAAEAAERQARAVLQMAQAYPGMSIEVAKQLDALNGQLQVAQARTGAEQMVKQEIADTVQLYLQGLKIEEAMAVAAAKRALTQEQINAGAEQQLKTLQNEYELLQAVTEEEKNRIRARQEYQKLVDAKVDPRIAGAIESQMLENARAQEQVTRATRQTTEEQEELTDEAKNYGRVIQNNTSFVQSHRIALDGVAYAWDNISDYAQSYRFTLSGIANDTKNAFNPEGYVSTLDELNVAGQKELAERMYGQIEPIKNILGHIIGYRAARDTTPGSLTKSIQEKLNANTDATRENTAATNSMTDVLSPFYSSDPRRTHLGFRAYAGGGIMTPYGDLPLKHYQGGGIASSPQVAVYGEGSTPEAFVPLPAGRIPVEIRQPANSNQRPVNVTINVMGNADANTVAALKSTAFQQAQSMRRALG